MESNFDFTNNWFGIAARSVWDQLIPQINPTRVLEVGSFEGASTCYLIDKIGSKQALEIHCVDTWEGGIEHKEGSDIQKDMSVVEARFLKNTQIAKRNATHNIELVVHKSSSELALSRLIASGKQSYFDFIYIDGSHQAPDVLFDALLGFRLLRPNGVMAFDDYLWQEQLPNGTDPIRCPKPAIDAFTNLYCRKLRILSAPLYQLYIQKTTD